jgi:selenocysteine lyase/cysteine desulfurase
MPEALEQRLIAAYQQQMEAYKRAHAIMDARAAHADWLAQLQEPLSVVAALELQMADDKRAWREGSHAPGAELRVLLDQLGEKIRTLKEAIDSEMAELLAQRSRLLPVIDDFIRQRWMLNAYARSAERV